MKAESDQSTISQAFIKVELRTSRRAILLIENVSCYVSFELKDYLSAVNLNPSTEL